MRLNTLKVLLNGTAHWEVRRGTHAESVAYCSKVETRVNGPWKIGVEKDSQGKRSDLLEVSDAIKSGASRKRIAEDFPCQLIKYSKGLDVLRRDIKPTLRWRNVVVNWFYGDTGVGKTRACMDSVTDVDDIHLVHSDGVWWDGYQGQDVILFDDFYGQIKCSLMLRLLDGHPLQLPVKGGFEKAYFTKVYITSNVHPNDENNKLYKDVPEKVREAFFRRINSITHIERVEEEELLQQSPVTHFAPSSVDTPPPPPSPQLPLPPQQPQRDFMDYRKELDERLDAEQARQRVPTTTTINVFDIHNKNKF